MANCPKCNAELKPGARFCHVCGFDTQSVSEQPVSVPVETPQVVIPQPQPEIQNQQTVINQNTSKMEQNTTPQPPVTSAQGSSNLISRVIGIITKPKHEWETIEKETPNQSAILMGYVLPLAIVAALATFIGYGLVGVRISLGFLGSAIVVKSITWGITQAITSLIVSVGGVFLTAFIIDSLAPSFKVEKNFGRSMQLVAYAYTPMWIGAVFTIYPNIALLGSLIGLYGLYLLWVGFDYTMKPAADKKTGYYLASLGVMIGIYLILGFILGLIMLSIYNPYSAGFNF